MQLWRLPATASPILVTEIYISYVGKIVVNRIDNIPWTINHTNLTQRICNSCTLTWWIKSWSYMITCELNQLWWWLSNASNHRNGGGGSACGMTGNVKLVLDDRLAWHEFLSGRQAQCGQGTTTTEEACFILTSSSLINTGWSSTSMSSTTCESSFTTEPGDKWILWNCV